MLTPFVLALFFLAFVSYLSAAALAALVLREAAGEEVSSDVAVAPVARLGPYVLVSIGIPWLLTIILGMRGVLELPLTMFMLVIVPSILMGSLLSSWLLMAMALARYGKVMLPGILAFSPPATLSAFLTLKALWHIACFAPQGYFLIILVFTTLMTFNGCMKQEVGHML
ncbi:MAG TPA: hypothetical protein ENF34_03195 [Candidatus Bathyarchaeota archaeon]|nr:hypothetical protein [Candidatus Bathyarchaeota archaeon]